MLHLFLNTLAKNRKNICSKEIQRFLNVKKQNYFVNDLKEIVALLRRILDVLERIEEKIDKGHKKEDVSINPLILLELPDNLRETMLALIKLKRADASDVAKITGRGRAIESHYLTTLARMGYVKKRRVGRRVIYEIIEK